MFARYNGIPLILILLAVIIGVYSFVGNHTVFGRRIYAIGGNEKATRLSGVNTKKVKLLVFTNMGLMTGLAGVVYLARLNYATLSAGADFAMDAIAACFIGGASSKGGAGTIFGTIVGALVMGILNNGMQMMGLGTDAQEFVKGLVLIFAVLLDVMTKSGNRE
jgi:putative multiple sugar transport system permease protein